VNWQIIQGDARHIPLTDQSVQCVVTSPPYWGLRDYKLEPKVWGGRKGCNHEWHIKSKAASSGQRYSETSSLQGGKDTQALSATHEPQSSQFCLCGAWLGTLGLEPTPNLYVQHIVEIFREVKRVLRDDGTLWLNMGDSYARPIEKGVKFQPSGKSYLTNRAAVEGLTGPDIPFGLKPKDLVGMPWRVAFALQADGWWLRSDIIWSKPNPMPESVTDRPTKAHEYLFLLTKSERYYWDQEAVKEDSVYWGLNSPESIKSPYGQGFTRRAKMPGWNMTDTRETYGMGAGNSGLRDLRRKAHTEGLSPSRNIRTVWEIATQPFPEAHFATFPEALVEPCIKAGSRAGDVVMDPFAGSGTVGVVALKHGRSFVGLDLQPDYCKMAVKRIEDDAPLFNRKL